MLLPTFTFRRRTGSLGSVSKDIFGSTNVQMGFDGNVGNEKETMQVLNERLASYLEKVRSLEKANGELEVKIRKILEIKGPENTDYSHFQPNLDKLRKEILEMTMRNKHVSLQVDNAKLAAHDYRMKFEHELQLRQYVEADLNVLRKLLDDTNMARLHLEHDVEGLKVELVEIEKQHQLEVSQIYGQITQSGVQVDVTATKGQDLAKIMEEMRATYEKIVLKNREDLKNWHDSKISVVQVQVLENTSALKESSTQLSVSRRQMQQLETELQSLTLNRASLEESLNETKLRYGMQLEQHNGILLMRESEIKQLRDEIQRHMLEYQTLFNIKMKLEAEIATYKKLLDGEDGFQSTSETGTHTMVEAIILH